MAQTGTKSSRRSDGFWLLLAALGLLLSACVDGAKDSGRQPGDGEDSLKQLYPDGTPRCIDKDGDGFGLGCGNGADCDDETPIVTNECYSCAGNATGCPCSEGQTIKCGTVTTSSSGEPGCLLGQKSCVNGAWSACRVDPHHPAPLKTMGLGGSTDCANNPCDPYCQHFPDDPDPTLTNDSGIVGTDAGLILQATPVDPGPPEECVNESAEAEPIPLDMYIMLDRSGSMNWGNRWNSIKTAITAFVNDSSSAGVTIGLDYFYGHHCSLSNYTNPSVDWGVLPANAGAITASLNATNPNGSTPTGPALEGAIDFAQTRANSAAGSGHKVIVVLATDGEPTSCYPRNINSIGNIAGAGRTGTPSIETYVIGVGPSTGNLNAIAAQGSVGGLPYMVDGGNAAQFLAAMQDIRNQSLGCEFTLPVNPSSGNIDADATEVGIKYGSHGTPTPLTQFADEVGCGANDGFYLNNPSNPSAIVLCPSTCGMVQGDSNYIVDLTFLCHANCAEHESSIDPIPLDLTVMLDQSGSMNRDDRWTSVTSALKTFVNDPSSDGVFMALDYFPDGSNQCLLSNYSTDVSVPWSVLPGASTAFINSLNSHTPGGGTPTGPALAGAIDYARKRAVAEPTHNVAVVLATDGQPNNCNSSINGVATVAANGFAGGGASANWTTTVGSAAYEDISTTGNATNAQGDDLTQGPFPIGFSFPYMGTDYSSFWVNTNGFMTLASAPPNWTHSNYPLPTSGGEYIAPFWDDLFVDGDVYYAVAGVAPNRRLIVQWNNARVYGLGGNLDFQAVLFENGEIEFRYRTLSGAGADGVSASVGLSNVRGTDGIGYSFNQAVLSPGMSIRFVSTTNSASWPSIRTYVIGVGYTTGLNTIAAAGGSGTAFLVDGGNADQFLAAMQYIRTQQMECEYTIPPSSLGAVDPLTLTVRYTEGTTGNTTDFSLLPGAAYCGATQGFYYDNPIQPKIVKLCPASCSIVQNDSDAQLNIFYDCLGNYPDGVFVRDYRADGLCPPGSSHIWTNWSWDAQTPLNSHIDFTVAVADTLTGLQSAPETDLRFSQPPGPSSLVGTPASAMAGTPDTQSGAASVDTSLSIAGMNRKAPYLRVRAKLYASTPNQTQSPILRDWEMALSCEASE